MERRHRLHRVGLTGTPEDLSGSCGHNRCRTSTATTLPAIKLCGWRLIVADLRSTDHVVSKITCRGNRWRRRHRGGWERGLLSASPAYNPTLLSQKVPVQRMVDLARRMKKNIPSGIVATGELDADLTVQRDTNRGGPIWEGGGAVVALNMRSPINNTRLWLERVPFAVSSHSDSALSVTAKRRQNRRILAVVLT